MNDDKNKVENTEAVAVTPPPLPMDTAIVEGNIVGLLLKSPRSVVSRIMGDKNLATESAKLLGAAVLFYAVFGLAIGLFGGWGVAKMTVWKAPLIALCAMLLCLPSLYVFTAVLGSPLAFGQAFTLGSTFLAMTGLILVGLAPVAWLFAVSTNSLGFVVMMAFVVWIVALSFVSKFLQRTKEMGLLKRQDGLMLWFAILVVVTLQMTTVMRPILTAPKEGERIIATGKKFFLSHFADSFETSKDRQ